MKSAEYFAERMKALEEARHKEAEAIADSIAENYEYAKRSIDEKIRSWYQRLADNNGVSFEEAQRLLTSSELEEFLWDVKQYIAKGKENAISGEWKKELENASAKYHITRLEAIKLQLRQICEEAAGKRLEKTAETIGKAYTDAYYHTAFEIQKGFGVGISIDLIDKRRVKSVLSDPWAADGRDFSSRIHSDLVLSVDTVNREITHMLLTGEAPDRAIAEIQKRLGISKSHAATMVYTEGAIFAQAGQKDCYNELGVEKYIIVETLDSKTCPICGDMDGKIFPMSAWEIGVTAPIFHPRCRGTTAPYFEDMEGTGERFARDVESGEGYLLPKETTYDEWKEMQDSAHGDGTVDKRRIKQYNREADLLQYERYSERLGNDVPSSFEAFQELKYSNKEQYDDLVGYYRYKGDNPESGKSFYEADKAFKFLCKSGNVRAKGVVVSTPLNCKILALNTHAIERMEERNISQNFAQRIIDNADFALKQRNGTRYSFYSNEGFAALDIDGTLATVGRLDEKGNILYNEVIKYVKKSSE